MNPDDAIHPARATARPFRPRLHAALAATVLVAAPCASPRAGDIPLTGDAAWARIVGNTISGTTPDGPYSEFFRTDGSLVIVDNDGKAGGRWRLRDGTLCTREDDEEEECRAVTVTGTAGAFTDEAGSLYPFDILPGNSKGL